MPLTGQPLPCPGQVLKHTMFARKGVRRFLDVSIAAAWGERSRSHAGSLRWPKSSPVLSAVLPEATWCCVPAQESDITRCGICTLYHKSIA